MKLAVTDACIFIDLFSVSLIDHFFELDIEVHTTHEVINELDNHQKAHLNTFQTNGKLTVHILQPTDFKTLHELNLPNALSFPDKTVLHIALKLNALVLSSDGAVSKNAGKLQLEYHGMLWIFDRLVICNILSPEQAHLLLTAMINKNSLYKNNLVFVKEAEARLKSWNKA